MDNNFTMNPQHKQNKRAARQRRSQRTINLIEDSLNREVISSELVKNFKQKHIHIFSPEDSIGGEIKDKLVSLKHHYAELVH